MDSDTTGHTSGHTAGHTLGQSEPATSLLPPPPPYSVNTRSLKNPSLLPSTASAPAESLQTPSSLGEGPAEGAGLNVVRVTPSDVKDNQPPSAGSAAAPAPLLRPSPQSASSASLSGVPATAATVQALRTPTVLPAPAVAAAAAVGASSEEDVRRAYSEMKRAYDDMKVQTWSGGNTLIPCSDRPFIDALMPNPGPSPQEHGRVCTALRDS